MNFKKLARGQLFTYGNAQKLLNRFAVLKIGYQLVASKSELAHSGERSSYTRPDGFSSIITENNRLLTQNYAQLEGYRATPGAGGAAAGSVPEGDATSLEIALLHSIKPNFQLAVSATKVAGALLFFPEDCVIVRTLGNGCPITIPVEKDTPQTVSIAEEYLGYALASCMRTNTFIETVRERNPSLTSPVLTFEQNYDLQNWLPQEVVKHMGLIRDLGFLVSGSAGSKPDLLRDWMRATLTQKGTYHERFYLMENKIYLSRHFKDQAFAAMDAATANIDVLRVLNKTLAVPQVRAQALRDPMIMNVMGAMRLVA